MPAVRALPTTTTTYHPASPSSSVPIPCITSNHDKESPSPPAAEEESVTELLSSSYPGAIKPVQLLQLQKQHVPRPARADEQSLFYNCTTPRHKVPPAPLHHTLELQDQVSLRSATAPAHVHHQGWHGNPDASSGFVSPAPAAVTAAESSNWRQHSSVLKSDGNIRRRQGRVKWYNQQKKYGFIISQDSKEYFVHRDDLKPINTILEPQLYTGEYVEYDPTPTQDGRLKASNVSGIEQGPLMCDHAKRPL